MTTMSDLSRDLEEEILCRVPITSLRAVRSTCKRWNLLSKEQSFAKKHCGKAAKETLVVRVFDYRACLICVNLHGIHNQKHLADPLIKQIGKLNQVEISKVFHCDGILLCVTRDFSRLVVLNAYSGQNRWIQPKNKSLHILAGFLSDMTATTTTKSCGFPIGLTTMSSISTILSLIYGGFLMSLLGKDFLGGVCP